jgi:hypothetical protein
LKAYYEAADRETTARAVRNYAEFYGVPILSVDRSVVERSSAGLAGWARMPDVRRAMPAPAVTVHLSVGGSVQLPIPAVGFTGLNDLKTRITQAGEPLTVGEFDVQRGGAALTDDSVGRARPGDELTVVPHPDATLMHFVLYTTYKDAVASGQTNIRDAYNSLRAAGVSADRITVIANDSGQYPDIPVDYPDARFSVLFDVLNGGRPVGPGRRSGHSLQRRDPVFFGVFGHGNNDDPRDPGRFYTRGVDARGNEEPDIYCEELLGRIADIFPEDGDRTVIGLFSMCFSQALARRAVDYDNSPAAQELTGKRLFLLFGGGLPRGEQQPGFWRAWFQHLQELGTAHLQGPGEVPDMPVIPGGASQYSSFGNAKTDCLANEFSRPSPQGEPMAVLQETIHRCTGGDHAAAERCARQIQDEIIDAEEFSAERNNLEDIIDRDDFQAILRQFPQIDRAELRRELVLVYTAPSCFPTTVEGGGLLRVHTTLSTASTAELLGLGHYAGQPTPQRSPRPRGGGGPPRPAEAEAEPSAEGPASGPTRAQIDRKRRELEAEVRREAIVRGAAAYAEPGNQRWIENQVEQRLVAWQRQQNNPGGPNYAR